MKIKICGIKTENEAEIINQTHPDFTGFVFAEGKRKVDFELAKKMKCILNPDINVAGIFVNNTLDEILNLYNKGRINTAQLHGEYSEEFIKELKQKSDISVIKVVRVQKKRYEITTCADFVLFDTFSKGIAGGTNKTFDWNIEIKSNVPYFIAGGLNENNIEAMIRKIKPFGVDISSGAEENGFKTKEKISSIINIVKGINL